MALGAEVARDASISMITTVTVTNQETTITNADSVDEGIDL